MVAQAPDRRAGRLAGAAGIALLLVGLTLLLEPASWRGRALALLAAGLVAGVAVALRLPASDRLRTPMERLNDGAFLVVVAAVALIVVRLARPWTAAVPGLVGGVADRPRPPPPPHPRPARNPAAWCRDPRPGGSPTPWPGGNPAPWARGPRRGRVAQPRKVWRRLSTPHPDPPGPTHPIRPPGRSWPGSAGQIRSRMTTGMSRRVLRW